MTGDALSKIAIMCLKTKNCRLPLKQSCSDTVRGLNQGD